MIRAPSMRVKSPSVPATARTAGCPGDVDEKSQYPDHQERERDIPKRFKRESRTGEDKDQ
jgi:hypothetical protein